MLHAKRMNTNIDVNLNVQTTVAPSPKFNITKRGDS
jgi:hypothetical protein